MDFQNEYVEVVDYNKDKNGTISFNKKAYSMNFLSKFFLQKAEDMLMPTLSDLQKQLNDIKEIVERLNEDNMRLNDIDNRLKKNISDTAVLIEEYNKTNVGANARYIEAVSFLCKINLMFKQAIPYFGSKRKLNILEMLVDYLYSSKIDLKNELGREANNDRRVSEILDLIEKFNKSSRNDIICYLQKIKSDWNRCLFFPENKVFQSDNMKIFNDIEKLEEGTPVYVLSLGYELPDSNVELEITTVCSRNN